MASYDIGRNLLSFQFMMISIVKEMFMKNVLLLLKSITTIFFQYFPFNLALIKFLKKQ